MKQVSKNKLIAFHGKKSIKGKYLKRVIAHRKADEIIKGTYWENGKGCAVGCTLEYSEQTTIHKLYETELGIPKDIARIEDWLFEHLKNGRAQKFPEQFLKAIPIGADLSKIARKFNIEILEYVKQFIKVSKYNPIINVIDNIISLHKQALTQEVTNDKWSAARSAAWSAAESAAWSAAWSAAYERFADIFLKLLKKAEI